MNNKGAAPMNALQTLSDFGQSVWLDYIRRSLITSGELKRLVDDDGLKGMTSNPAIFEKAIAGSTDYRAAFDTLADEKALDAKTVYERMALEDIRLAAAVLEPVFESTRRRDGYISLEVSPHLAHDAKGTCEEARRLWQALGRENIMIKVPATAAGLTSIEDLIAEGINVNVTLLFSQTVYERVVEAYLRGLERLTERGGDPGKVASVASFFISRIDAAIDAVIGDPLAGARTPAEQDLVEQVAGRVAIANARLTYARYQALFSGARWQALEKKGARTQRLLWASTGTKNPAYRDVLYVEELIGPDTVNTLPPATLDAFRDHGEPRASLEEGLEAARETLLALETLGISLPEVTDRLLDEGLRLFAEAFDKLLGAVACAHAAAAAAPVGRQTTELPQALAARVSAALEDWEARGNSHRLWARDASLWTGGDEAEWLGWLGITEDQEGGLAPLQALAGEVKNGGFRHVLLLGMGGSSLCPEVLAMTFGELEGHPALHVLDSTDPAQVKATEDKIDLAHTLFIVSSKSGSTLEPNVFKQYFFERVAQALGTEQAGSRFIAITDPGSQLERVAQADRFRRLFYGMPSIGGRYSALSHFGMVPAAVMGLDLPRFMDRADQMAQACAACVPTGDNPGVVLGAHLGVLGSGGRDKLTLVTSPEISGLGGWLEQLIAESTGKQGKAVIPVDREALGPPEVYGDDRLFVYLRLDSAPDAGQEAAVARLAQAGQPVVRISLSDRYDLAQEFFRWEIATAVAGAILGINPFDQPDVEASKIATRELTTAYESTGALPPETPLVEDGDFTLFTDEDNAAALLRATGEGRSVAAVINAHLDRLGPGDYFALLAYVEMSPGHDEPLQAARHALRDAKRVATCLEYGPRFLHSTGQAYKGGPATGVFLQITCDDAVDLPVPGQRYSFGVVKAAQARGDFRVLAARKRRVLRVHLGKDVQAGLDRLRELIMQSL